MEGIYSAVILVGIILIIVLYLLPRYGPHYRSKLTCPDCNRQFTYHWIPGGSFLALRSGKMRKLKCPYCHKQSLYDVITNRIRKPKKNKPKNKKGK
ncbi:MAG: hypothetical protein GX638_18170 [Crenarchaeota archaeon]|nr:hypothetical protein [Thermoproteota archaeon]